MATLWATPSDRDLLEAAQSAVLLVGSYDGSGNYGDVLQLAGALDTVRGLPAAPLPVALVEHETVRHHRELMQRHSQLFDGAAFVFYDDGRGEPVDGLVALRDGSAPSASALHLYGGGYLNGWWAERKVAHAAAAQGLAAQRSLPVTASGVQVDEAAVAPGGPAHALLARAAWVGLRDPASLDIARRHLPRAKAALGGDDAHPFLFHGGSMEPEWVVNVHLNEGVWVSDDPPALMSRIAGLLTALGDSANAPLELRPVVAYEDPRVSERALTARFLESHLEEIAAHGLRPAPPLDMLDDAARRDLANFRRARITVSCSYHVTLSSLLAGVPAVLFAENAYYDQKARGLRDLFGLDPGLIGVRGTPADAAAAAMVAVEGEERDALVARLRRGAAGVAARHAAAREALTAALQNSLRPAPAARLRGLGRHLAARVRGGG